MERAGAGKASLKAYAAGFFYSIALTEIAFWMVMHGERTLPRWVVVGGIFLAAVVQILIHLHYFLHLDRSSTVRWNVLALVFTVLIITIFIGGTLWIMSNLHYRMM
jgi:cytochrome o ubiquinol oxidase subunit IV